MNIFTSVIEQLKDTLTPNRMKGESFEKWVLDNSPVSSAKGSTQTYWTFHEWRGDKRYKNLYPRNNNAPDFVFINENNEHLIGIECKFRTKACMLEFNRKAYEDFKSNYKFDKISVNEVYLVIGVGLKYSFQDFIPKTVYVISLSEALKKETHQNTKYKGYLNLEADYMKNYIQPYDNRNYLFFKKV